jgi:hypothetical protein
MRGRRVAIGWFLIDRRLLILGFIPGVMLSAATSALLGLISFEGPAW